MSKVSKFCLKKYKTWLLVCIIYSLLTLLISSLHVCQAVLVFVPVSKVSYMHLPMLKSWWTLVQYLLAEIRDRPKMDFTFSAVNETGAENGRSFSARNWNENEKRYSFSAKNENESNQIKQQHMIMKLSVWSFATVLTFNAK